MTEDLGSDDFTVGSLEVDNMAPLQQVISIASSPFSF